jgi:hypothetical protein
VSREIQGLEVQLEAAEEDAQDQGEIDYLRESILELRRTETALRQREAKLTPGTCSEHLLQEPHPLATVRLRSTERAGA